MGTGGGPAPDVIGLGLRPIYERVIQLIGVTAAVGTAAVNPLQVLTIENFTFINNEFLSECSEVVRSQSVAVKYAAASCGSLTSSYSCPQ